MIRPEGFRGVAFGDALDGDGRTDAQVRADVSARFGLPAGWATVEQVHGCDVVVAEDPGSVGQADAIVTTRPGLPIAIATADCLPIVVEADHEDGGAVGIIHAGWRGVVSGVIEAAVARLAALGATPVRAAIGPAIGPCCYEVGAEVLAAIPDARSITAHGTPSVDLPGAARHRLTAAGVPEDGIWVADICTRDHPRYHSHRRNGTRARNVAVAWVPASA